ncbi:unnamed protein product [Timema podura]|uniref:SH3 domain-containing protein n=1 Tax=Timema podura TaxID=61482 RepID=A0ABN7NHA1_TIMPD|nr:unnamed protein product [Timema podura]
MYAYLSSGDNQLSFLEGDIISLMGERNKGWQFGENLRTQCSGWFSPGLHRAHCGRWHQSFDSTGTSTTATTPATPTNHMSSSFGAVTSPTGGAALGHAVGTNLSGKSGTNPDTSRSAAAAVTMFGDTLAHRSTFSKQFVVIGKGALDFPNLDTNGLTGTQHYIGQQASCTLTMAHQLGDLEKYIGNLNNSLIIPVNKAKLKIRRGNTCSRKPSRNNTRSPIANNESPLEDVKDKRKKQLISSVRGWLLYKSALDLWDDVNNQYSSKTTNNKLTEVNDTTSKATLTASQAKHSNAMRQASSLGHLATLGRAENEVESNGLHPNNHTVVKSTRADDTESIKGAPTVKRSKSLWKFKRSHKDSVILEGMSLWRHRSLVDVNDASGHENKTRRDEDGGEHRNQRGRLGRRIRDLADKRE